jgi:hypothetical protein
MGARDAHQSPDFTRRVEALALLRGWGSFSEPVDPRRLVDVLASTEGDTGEREQRQLAVIALCRSPRDRYRLPKAGLDSTCEVCSGGARLRGRQSPVRRVDWAKLGERSVTDLEEIIFELAEDPAVGKVPAGDFSDYGRLWWEQDVVRRDVLVGPCCAEREVRRCRHEVPQVGGDWVRCRNLAQGKYYCAEHSLPAAQADRRKDTARGGQGLPEILATASDRGLLRHRRLLARATADDLARSVPHS